MMNIYTVDIKRDNENIICFSMLVQAESFESASSKVVEFLRECGKAYQKDNPHTNTEFWYLDPCYIHQFTESTPKTLPGNTVYYSHASHREYVYWEKDGEVKWEFREVDGW